MIPYLAELPPEVYSAILTQVSQEERQQAVLSLTRAIPRSPVPSHHLFECIHLKSAERVVQLYCRLRGRFEEPRWIRQLSLETWSVDADVAVNLLALLPRLAEVTLFIGPNFTPEHLEEILEKPRKGLSYMSLRFRPYLGCRQDPAADRKPTCVQRATYYQFLKGAYFDTALDALSGWPADLSTLSIVQDPLDPEIARTHYFAQPLVFFRLDPISTLAGSPFLRTLTSLRLRIPSRQVARFVYSPPRAMPGLRILDLSTCHVRLADAEALAARFRQLQHLIVDGCNITSSDAQENEWVNVGKTLALATVKAAKEREKKLKRWLETRTQSLNLGSEAVPEEHITVAATRRVRPGRRGLATATISLRETPTAPTPAPAIWANGVVPKVRIVPAFLALRSLSIATSTLHDDKQDVIRAQFERGWDEGLTQLTAIRSRLYQSWKNGVKVVRIVGDQGTEEGLEGLEDVKEESAFYGRHESADVRPVPVLCLAGAVSESAQHVDGCGHAAARHVWLDGI